ncbi:MAG TPA: small multidrug efflux protein [Glaciihabitans sp.]|jgi:hypothetical protein|nr:small multidrug efflux protein [Glaciihabitans sp.]
MNAIPANVFADSPLTDVISTFQTTVAQVPELLRPVIVAAAGAVPFVEGELASIIGVIGGLHPVVAAVAAATGNFLCVLVVVLLTSRARGAIINRAGRPVEEKPLSKGRQRLQRWFARFGVPGASVLGPLAIPTQFTAATLVAAGAPKGTILLWQAIAIVLWTTVTTLSILGALAVLT